MPYGIFTPMTGSVSGIYLRLPKPFMQREDGGFDLTVYPEIWICWSERFRIGYGQNMAMSTKVQRGQWRWSAVCIRWGPKSPIPSIMSMWLPMAAI